MPILRAEKPRVYYQGAEPLSRKRTGSFRVKKSKSKNSLRPSGDETDQTRDDNFTRQLVEGIPLLHEPYEPVSVWGYNGHCQTVKFSLTNSRSGLRVAPKHRVPLKLPDGTTFSYDTFLPAEGLRVNGVWVAIAPGLANSSNDCYLEALGTLLVSHGYHTAVLNPPGTIKTESLSTPRIFNFGCTEYYGAMVEDLVHKHPDVKLIAIGLSLGGNLVCKYLGEDKSHQKPFIACISGCQGYDFLKHRELTPDRKVARMFYLKRMGGRIRDTIVHFKDVLFSNDLNGGSSFPPDIVEKLSKIDRIDELDELFTIKQTGHATVEDYYTWASCSGYLDQIEIPILFINAEDDPLFSLKQLDIPKAHADQHKNSLFVLTKHGGHLGFYQKTGKKKIDTYTWLDKLCLQYINRSMELEHRKGRKNTDFEADRNVAFNVKEGELEVTSTNTATASRDAASDLPHAQSTIAMKTDDDEEMVLDRNENKTTLVKSFTTLGFEE